MTKLWGPLGWMTLHSASFIYPDNPTPAEKAIATRFLDLFAETISCNACKIHFKSMRAIYTTMYPGYLNSKTDFAYFVFRAHNTVNKRVDKPRYPTVSACLDAVRSATVNTSLSQFRQSYMAYLVRNWGRDTSGEGRMIKSQVTELIKINNEYWSLRETGIPNLPEADVLSPIEKEATRVSFRPTGATAVSTNIGFRLGKLRLRNH
jgi:hypothetical protein